MKKRFQLSTQRAVELFNEAVSTRRDYCADSDFFKMSTFWRDTCEESKSWNIKTFRSNKGDDYRRKAGVVALGDSVTLIVDEQLMENADRGCLLSNFMLAHEVGHLILDHHAQNKVIKNFQLFSGSGGMSNIPPTLEEYETNVVAAFFQCGPALMSRDREFFELARRAYSDPHYVKMLGQMVRLDLFANELERRTRAFPRVIL